MIIDNQGNQNENSNPEEVKRTIISGNSELLYKKEKEKTKRERERIPKIEALGCWELEMKTETPKK